MYKSYGLLRPLVVFAGTIGILQSLIWIAMSICAILAYYCIFSFRGMVPSLGTITELTLCQMYFHGNASGPCKNEMPNLDYTTINRLNLLKPFHVHICMWIYCGVSFLWLISSITMLTSVRYVNLRNANCFLYFWIMLTLGLSILDLVLGIAFGIDYDTLRHEAHNIAVNEWGGTEQPQYLIVSARTAAAFMMGIIFRGYTVWLINVVLCIYFFTQTFKISDYNRIKEAILNQSFTSNGTLNKKAQQPTSPHREKNDQWLESLHNYSYQQGPSDRPIKDIHRHNQAAALFEERKRHYEAQQMNYLRYIDKLNGRKLRSHQNENGPSSSKKRREVNVPEPDYSPNIHRIESFEARPPLRSALRTSRY